MLPYHSNPPLGNHPTELARLRRLEARAEQLSKHHTVSEDDMSLARVTANVARRAQLIESNQVPDDPGLWPALWGLGERIAAIENQINRDHATLILTPPRTFSQRIWDAEKRPSPSRWSEAA